MYLVRLIHRCVFLSFPGTHRLARATCTRTRLPVALTCLWFGLWCQTSYGEKSWGRDLAPGISYYHIKQGSPAWPNHVFVLKINYTSPCLRVKPVLAYDHVGRLERVSRLCRRVGALAAINGTFFSRGEKPALPIGLVIVDGKVLQKTKLYRTAFGITDRGTAIIGVPRAQLQVDLPHGHRTVGLWGINRPRKADEVILYTSEYGTRTRTNPSGLEIVVRNGQVVQRTVNNTPIPSEGYVLSFHGTSRGMFPWFELGEPVRRAFSLSAGWESVVEALSGGPRLVAEGRVYVGQHRENFGKNYRVPNPRTAVGVTYDHKLLFVVVDGRQVGYSVGMTFTELARLLVRLGAKEAMGLDSGGSSVMSLRGTIVNRPSEGRERPASNALAVWHLQEDLAHKSGDTPGGIRLATE
ncbi:MAG: phosphodiester glycosidase family protein [Armatimonadetes bacterium]|nr:phosphodiester glycosidase family protein [Armatimonadota bacterium]